MRGQIHHIDLTVRDLAASAEFYRHILEFLGYRKVRDDEGGVNWSFEQDGPFCSIGLKPARSNASHDRYAAGLHHLAWTARSRADVDHLFAILLGMDATVLDPPADYPEYGEEYFALFFADPDGIKLEYVYAPGRAGKAGA